MSDPKVVQELQAAIERGRAAQSTLAKLEALDAVEATADAERFRKLSSIERAEIRRKHPEHYAKMWDEVRQKAEADLVAKGGR